VFADFLSGFRYFIKGVRIIARPGIRRFVIIPLFINMLVFTLGLFVGIDQFQNLLEWLLPGGDAWWLEFARITLWVVFSAVAFLIVFFTFTLVANLLGAPFNGLLSEKVERLITGVVDEDAGGIRAVIKTIPSSIMSEIRKFSYFIVLGAIIFLFTLVPGVNALSPIIWGIFMSWMLALEYLAYPMENYNMYFSQVRSGLRKRRAISFGFGVAVMIGTMIPVVNFMVMPAAVAGATALWAERLRQAESGMKR
jgi:CysZ protein